MAQIIRITYFKIDPADRDFALDLAKTMYANNKKVFEFQPETKRADVSV
jgi:hypothetical protein